MHLSAGLALVLGRMDQTVNLLARLASALSSRFAEVPHEQSLANSSLTKSTGKPGNGRPKLDGVRLQALYPKGISFGHMSPEKCIIVVRRDKLRTAE
jgi:hypothetical protein